MVPIWVLAGASLAIGEYLYLRAKLAHVNVKLFIFKVRIRKLRSELVAVLRDRDKLRSELVALTDQRVDLLLSEGQPLPQDGDCQGSLNRVLG